MHRLTGIVQHYDWGSTDAIPKLLSRPPDGRPWAEWWLGTHPNAPSTLDDGTALSTLSGELPYLLKVLAAAEPLSLQTHPSKAQAEKGFAREKSAGVPASSPSRLYHDPNAKPELLCALTKFEALCGIRPADDTIALLKELRAFHLADEVINNGVGAVIEHLYRRNIDLYPTIDVCSRRSEPEARLVAALATAYPNDPSVVVTLLLNRVVLRPGEAIYLTPGNLHAYLHGVGVEVMGASDNVIRGGMTTKHVDVAELLTVLDTSPLVDPVLRPTAVAPGVSRYDTPEAPFRLWRYELNGPLDVRTTTRELWLCTAGTAGELRPGTAVFLDVGDRLQVTGTATLFRVEER
jgi:mannose-6-phosphate isomerase